MTRIQTIAFLVLWQGGWFLAVAAAGAGCPGPAALATVPAVLVGAWRVPGAWRLALAAVVLGMVGDGLLGVAGVMNAHGSLPDGGWAGGAGHVALSPPWMWGLWAQFALAFAGPLGWLRQRIWLAAAFGAIGGPLAYGGGLGLGALTAPAGTTILLLASAVLYGVTTPLLARLVQRWVRPSPTAPSPGEPGPAVEVPRG